jgi:hypothetical protein
MLYRFSAEELSKFWDPDKHPRGWRGEFVSTGSMNMPSLEKPESGVKNLTDNGRPNGLGTPEDPIDVKGNIDRALLLLAQGKNVRLNHPDEVTMIADDINKLGADFKAHGENMPDVDFGKLTLTGSNLFTAQSEGIPRMKMPQLSGIAAPGSEAARIAGGAGKNVDLTDLFRKDLEAHGIKVTDEIVPSSHLRATQDQLKGSSVAGIAQAWLDGVPAVKQMMKEPIFVTRDNYIIDGHHRWAASMVLDARDGKLGDTTMEVHKADMDIGAAIPYANDFANRMGIPPQGLEGNTTLVQKKFGMVQHESYGLWDTKKSAKTPELASVHRPLGTHGLWGDKASQLPAYIQNIAHAMIRDGHDEGSAIALAVAAVKRWAAGGDHVTPEVQTAAGAALAEWEKLRAEHAGKFSAAELSKMWDPDKHPRGLRGEFTSSGSAAGSPAPSHGMNEASVYASAYSKLLSKPIDKKRLDQCYALAGKYEMSDPDADKLVHGSIQGMGQPRLDHAWVTLKSGDIWEPASNQVYTPAEFSAVFHPQANSSYSHQEAIKQMGDSGNFGPWSSQKSRITLTVAELARKGDLDIWEDELRDAHGRWSHSGSGGESLQEAKLEPATRQSLAVVSNRSQVYTDDQTKKLENRVNELESRLQRDETSAYKMDGLTDLAGVIAATILAFVTGGISIAVIVALAVSQAPVIVPIIAKWVSARASHTENPFTPLKPGEKSAKDAIGITASRLAGILIDAGLNPIIAQKFATAVVSKAAAALAAGKFPGDDGFFTAADKKEILDAIDPAAKKNARVTLTVSELAELVKIGGPEGYIHGYVCVRPPCGKEPEKIKPADLAVQRDGGVVHRPSGYAVGHVAKDETGKWTASHADGAKTTHGSRSNALKTVARRYNSGKNISSLDNTSASVEAPMRPDELPQSVEPVKLPRSNGVSSLAFSNRQGRVYTDTQVKSLQDQLNKLQAELHQEKHKEKKMSVAIELGSVAAAIGLAFVTGGLSLGLLGPALVHESPNIGKAIAEWIHARLGHTENPFTPLRSGEKSAQPSVTTMQQEQVVATLAQLFSQPGLSLTDAQSFSTLVVAQAAKALAAGRFPGDDGFVSADDIQSVKDALSPGQAAVKIRVRDLISL